MTRARHARNVRNDHDMASADGIRPSGELAVTAPMAGVVVEIARGPREAVGAGTPVVVLEAMKLEHEVLAEGSGVVRSVEVAVGDAVEEGQLLVVLTAGPDGTTDAAPAPQPAESEGPRGDLEAVRARHALGLDGPGRTRSRGVESGDGARRARTSPTCSTTARSSSTAR